MPETTYAQNVEIDPLYHVRQWTPYGLCFLTSFGSYFSNGGHLPHTLEGWTVFIINILTWAMMALNMQTQAVKVSK